VRVEGTAKLAGKPAALFDRLLDPDTLRSCIKGCESFDVDPDADPDARAYVATVKVGVGAVKGRFRTTVALSGIEPPVRYTMNISAKSPVGRANGTAVVQLEEREGETHLAWETDVRVSGVIAAVGQRLLGAAAKRFAGQFFEQLQATVGSGGDGSP